MGAPGGIPYADGVTAELLPGTGEFMPAARTPLSSPIPRRWGGRVAGAGTDSGPRPPAALRSECFVRPCCGGHAAASG
ncbi:hypothetical protein GCM10009535_00340 [Streptomyces thermocarboxydovorans]|uniref:Uncharacterized protein n=1 Tax=Streptomyces thermocarboxydovorans TaxID=59298 RepID=A0ABN1H4U2_9ACTN